MDRNKPGYMNFDDIADRLESGKLNAYDVVYTKDTHEVVFIKEDLSLIRMKCRLDVYPSVVVAEYYLNLNTDTYVGQIVGIEQGEWICLYNVNYADNKFIVRKVGVDEYGQLANKPQINGVTLEGNKTTEQLGINIPTKFSQLYDDIGYVTFDHLIENYYSKSQTYSKSEVDTALAGKADTNDIPTDLADLQDDSTHRTVTDENIAAWNAKSNVVANPAETTRALNSIEIDGVAYAVAGSGGGAVHSVNGKTGDVVLGASDVHALPDDTPLFSGDYNDLENKPDIPDDLADLHDDTNHRTVTDAEKTQWNAAEANVQADWNQTTTLADDYIKNKPANLVQDANYVHTDNNFTNANKTKLNDIEAGAEVNVQSDWNQTDSTQDDYIKNKPAIPDPQIQSDWNQTSGTAKDYIKNKPTLGTASALDVATSGDASSTQVVKGDDSRLSDARTPVSHTHTLSEITDAGTAASKDSTSSVTTGSTDLVESGAVKTAIDNAISGAYKHAGTKTCAELISSLLVATNQGNVYNITDSGTTTLDFIEGAGIPIRAGDNVGIAKISDGVYKFDLLSGFIDTSNFITKSSTSGLVKSDGSIDTTEYAPASSVPAAQIQSDWSQSDNTKLDYIKNKPALGTASAKNAPSSGNASASEVVMGNDTRLTDARNAADVYSWAKAENKPSYSKSEVGLGNVDNTSDATKKSNFTGSIASGNTGFVTGGDVYSALGDKVDKVEGKDLSTNDYDDTAKGIVDGVTSALANKADKSEMSISTSGDQTTIQLKSGTSATVINAHQDISGKADKSEMSVSTSGDKTTIQLKSGTSAEVLSQHQDISGKADKSEMSVTDGTGADADKTTIQLKSDTSATVLKTHQDISGKADKVSGAINGNLAGLDANGNLTDSGVAKSDIDEMQDELSTDSATVTGNPINFTTLSAQTAKSTILSLEPIQDLHGYDKPWVGGAGKNKFDDALIANPTATAKWVQVTLKPNTNYTVSSNIPYYSTSAYIFAVSGTDTSGATSATDGVGLNRQRTVTADSNGIISFAYRNNGGDGVLDLTQYHYQIEEGSSATSYEPYENICPITGCTEIGILGCGENLWDRQWEVGVFNQTTGLPESGTSNAYRTKNKIAIESNKSYIFKSNVAGRFFFYSGIEDIASNYISNTVVNQDTAFTTPQNAHYMNFQASDTIDVSNVTINRQSTDLTIDLGRTVYGGTLDVENGVLVVTDKIETLNNYEWNYNSTYKVFISQGDIADAPRPVMPGYPVISSAYNDIYDGTNKSISQIKNGNIGFALYAITNSRTCICIGDYRFTDEINFINAVGNETFVYPLAAPLTLQLTPNEINLLKGVNNISTTGDKITLTYRNGSVATLADLLDLEKKLTDEEPYGFIEHMSILDPAQRIEYIGKNKNYKPMTINLAGDHLANYNEWYDFPVIKENKPYMIKADGTVDYALDPNDYTKKFDGSDSDVANTSYTGGAFAWIPKTYKREFVVGNDRYVYISTKKLSDEYEAIGFIDENGLEHDGAWIPMFYGTEITQDGTVKIMSLATGVPTQNRNTDTQKTYIENFSSQAKFFGGPIMNVLADLLIMLGKNSDIQAVFGTGNMSAGDGAQYMKDNACINGGAFYGTTVNNVLNKAFHSLVLLTQNQWQRDPYTLCYKGEYIVSPYYKYDLTGDSYVKTGVFVTPPSSNNWVYPNRSVSVPHWGAEPVGPYSGSTTTGWADGQYTLATQLTDTTVRVVRRFGHCDAGRNGGVRCVNLRTAASDTSWIIGASPLLLSKDKTLN